MLEQKPYAISCDRNSEPILEVLKSKLKGKKHLFEVGAGTAQHAIFMAPHFLETTWTVSDRQENHDGIQLWLRDFPRTNVQGPLRYEIGKDPFPGSDVDMVFTANTIHIVSWETSLKLFEDLSTHLKSGGEFLVYGAFNYNGQFTSPSNEKFNQWLLDRDSQSGIRDFELVKQALAERSFQLLDDIEMPANNRMLHFRKD